MTALAMKQVELPNVFDKQHCNSKPKVLLVDDELDILVGLKRSFRGEFAIEAAPSAAEAIRMMKSNGPFAVIISDLHMPWEDGITFLAKAKQISPPSVRILLTGDGTPANAIEAINRSDIFRLLAKPCSQELMRQTLLAAVATYENRPKPKRASRQFEYIKST